MAIPALDITVGGASANSYVTAEEAETFLDSRLNADAWTGVGVDDKTRALLMAAQRLDRENWLGNRVTTTQRLAWPRVDVAKVDPVGVGFGGWGFGTHSYAWWSEVYKSDEIPQSVKDAQCELALAYLEGFDESGDDAIDSFSADGVSVKHRQSRPDGGLPPKVLQLIGGLIAGNRLVRG
jgi:DnaT-like ssDNA binding protein